MLNQYIRNSNLTELWVQDSNRSIGWATSEVIVATCARGKLDQNWKCRDLAEDAAPRNLIKIEKVVKMSLVQHPEKFQTAITSERRLVLKNRKRQTPTNFWCRVKLRSQKMERSSSVISRKRRLVSKFRKRQTPPNLTCRVQMRTQKMERSSSVISRKRRLISKFCKRWTPPNLTCQVQICTQKMERLSSVISWKRRLISKFCKRRTPLIGHALFKYGLKKWKGRLPSYLGNEGSYQNSVKGRPPLIWHAEF